MQNRVPAPVLSDVEACPEHGRRRVRDEEDKAALAVFAPVPRQKVRHDGWTPERQRPGLNTLHAHQSHVPPRVPARQCATFVTLAAFRSTPHHQYLG